MAQNANQAQIDKVAKELQKLQLRLSQIAAKITSATLLTEELTDCEQTISDLKAKVDKLKNLGEKPVGI